MKKTIKTIGMAAIIGIAALLFNGCKGKDGAPGADGPKGTAGTNGTNGNANVHSYTFQNLQFSGTSSPYNIFISNSIFTQQVFDSASVQVYIKDRSYTAAWQLGPCDVFNSVYLGVGHIDLFSPTNWTSLGYSWDVRVVIIPAAMIVQHPNVNFKDYAAVKNTFNLTD